MLFAARVKIWALPHGVRGLPQGLQVAGFRTWEHEFMSLPSPKPSALNPKPLNRAKVCSERRVEPKSELRGSGSGDYWALAKGFNLKLP